MIRPLRNVAIVLVVLKSRRSEEDCDVRQTREVKRDLSFCKGANLIPVVGSTVRSQTPNAHRG